MTRSCSPSRARIALWPAAALAIAACAPGKTPQQTEQDLHAEEIGLGGKVEHHLFRCEHGRTLLVDFEDEGLTLSIRDSPTDAPFKLTARAQGEPFLGERGSATMKDQSIQMALADGTRRTCMRQTKG